ncbi:FAD linked oxidase domain-containing protein [Rhodovulum sulfidophilum]|uniref:FAD linked oxidase domain-containing protein n=1 Tax=Rhodovulum sulfidophilum TaxID=35806 RepID=A0A0D6B5V0_RHOSU|nr:FAD linked oxidase domain-containing protein [Rhodovulum sulfidophilum]
MMRPETEADLAGMVAAAEAPLRIEGGGTRGLGGEGAGLRLSALSGVVLYEPGALTLVVKAGTALAEVEAVLAAEGQRLAFEPMDHRRLLGREGVPTIGGVAAANVSGPRRVQVGACRDAMLGLRFVDGRGEVIRNGGRVMKNVTGYDLVKLMAGSRGTLGVLTEIAFKVLPVPEAAAALVLEGLSDDAAVAAMAAALGAPFDVSGAAHLPETGETLIRIEGFAASVDYRAGRLAELLDRFGGARVESDPVAGAALWRRVRDVEDFADRPGDVWRISVRPSDGPRAAQAARAEAAVYDWGGGLVWVLVGEGRDIRPDLAGISGHATRVRGAGPLASAEPAPLAAMAARLKAAFDPKGILNPGAMG